MRNYLISIFETLFGNTKLKVSKIETSDVICNHITRDRVMTHRGFHCNNCGKKF